MKLEQAVALALSALVFSTTALADGVQVCVDSKGASYTAKITGFAKAHEAFSGVLTSQGGAIPNGTDLGKISLKGNLADVEGANIEEMSFALKHLVAPTTESVQDSGEYRDEPRVYEASGVDLVCSSTMSEDEFAALAK